MSNASMEFVVHAEDVTALRHRSIFYLEHRASGLLLDGDEEEEEVSARWSERGTWQQFAVEKLQPPGDLMPVTPKKQLRPPKDEEDASALAVLTPPGKRKASQTGATTAQNQSPNKPSG